MVEHLTIDWQYLSDVLSKQYGADHAQEALCRLIEKLSNGADIENPLAYAARTCKGLAYEEKNPKVQRTSLDAMLGVVSDNIRLERQLIDENDPERLAIYAQESRRIDAIRAEYAVKCADTGFSQQTRSKWRQRYKAAIREAS